MAVSSTATAVRYVGNGSTVTTYAIPFAFLDTSHIKLAISEDGTEDPEVQSTSAYEVIRNSVGSGGTLRTVAAVSSPDEVVIYRETPLTQPSHFQLQGPFPSKTAETALDRLELQTQELNTRILSLEGEDTGVPAGTGSGAATATWLNAAARAAVVPAMVGQLGVERATQTIWIAQSTTAGDWEEFAKRRTNRVVIGLLADAGTPGDPQTAAALALDEWEVDAVLFAGDNNYSGAASYDTDWAAFLDYINAGVAYPALGNHDVDEDGWQTRLNTKFPYLPGNRRYYTVTLGDGLVDLFVLNSGYNSTFDLLEADGNTVGSVQHAWFVAQLALSRARWKIVMFHHPPATSNDDTEGHIAPAMAWPELAQVDLICCGHNHLLELLKYSNVMLATMGAIANVNATAAAVLQGGEIDDASVWVDDENRGLARIVASQERLTIEVWSCNGDDYGTDRRLLHVRDCRDFIRPPRIVEGFRVYADDATPTGTDVYVTRLLVPTILREITVRNVIADGSTWAFSLKAGIVDIGSGELAASEVQEIIPSLVSDMLPAGTLITITTAATDSREGLSVILTMERLS